MGDIPCHFSEVFVEVFIQVCQVPAWKASVRKSDLPPQCPVKGMEMGKAMPEVDAFGVDAAVGAEEVEVTWMLVSSILKPGGGGREVGNRDTPVTMPAGTDARGAPPKTGTEVVGTGLAPKAEIPGRGVTAGGGTMGITGGATVGCTMGVTGA